MKWLFHLCSLLVLISNGRVLCWGYNDYGQLGRDGTASFGATGSLATAQAIVFSDTVPAISIATQAVHVCAAFANGKSRCWGFNSSEQLGDGTTIYRGSAPGFYSVSLAPYISFGPAMTHLVVQVTTGSYEITLPIFDEVFLQILIYSSKIFILFLGIIHADCSATRGSSAGAGGWPRAASWERISQ